MPDYEDIAGALLLDHRVFNAELRQAIAAALRSADKTGAERVKEAAGMLHENINPASDNERLHGDPGAGAMGAVIEYRDAIRALPTKPPT